MSDNISIVRVIKGRANPYTMIHVGFANDPDLRFEDRGLMTYVLTKPDDWQIQINDLIKASPAGRDSVYAILKRLMECGYLQRITVRDVKTKRIIRVTYRIFETKQEDLEWKQELLTAEPDTAEPDREKADSFNIVLKEPNINSVARSTSRRKTKNPADDRADNPPIHSAIMDMFDRKLLQYEGFRLRDDRGKSGQAAKAAKALRDRGFDQSDLALLGAFIDERKQNGFYADRHLPFVRVAEDFAAWKIRHRQEMNPAIEPLTDDVPSDFDVLYGYEDMDDDGILCD